MEIWILLVVLISPQGDPQGRSELEYTGAQAKQQCEAARDGWIAAYTGRPDGRTVRAGCTRK